MTNVTVMFEYEEPEYCRLCLSKETDNNELSMIQSETIGIIRELLQIQLDKTDSDAFICSTCVESLEEFDTYRTRCQRNNVALQKKADERKQRQIELAKSAIANTNVLDQVKDGEPIKVVIRMNAEGKASVRLQVQSKPQPKTEEKPVLAKVPEPSVPSSSKANIPKEDPAPQKPTTKKLIRLPMQPFYFYKTSPRSSYGLIYGGYRYCASVPRKQHIYWMCEQRKSHKCDAVFLVNKNYTEFLLNCGHNHDPPQVKRNQRIFKAADVLPDVMRSERVRENQQNDSGQQRQSKEDDDDSSDEEYASEEDSDDDDGTIEVQCDEDIADDESRDADGEDTRQSAEGTSGIKKEQVDDGDECMYIIQELS